MKVYVLIQDSEYCGVYHNTEEIIDQLESEYLLFVPKTEGRFTYINGHHLTTNRYTNFIIVEEEL